MAIFSSITCILIAEITVVENWTRNKGCGIYRQLARLVVTTINMFMVNYCEMYIDNNRYFSFVTRLKRYLTGLTINKKTNDL
jgi:hypothetical protein